jgi:predicted dehydrogenase
VEKALKTEIKNAFRLLYSPVMLRWGIIGTSFISHIVAASIKASPKSTIVAAFGRDAGRLDAFARKFSVPKQYQSMDELLDDTEVDVVYIGLPSHLHSQATVAAAKRGKAILSEKALTTTMDDAKALVAAVREANVFFVEGLMFLSHPLMAKAGDIIRSGALGSVRGISGYYAANLVKKANPLGMGTIYNLGCYPVALLHWVMQAAYGRDAIKGRRIGGLGNLAPDGSHVRDASLQVRFDNGVLASIQSTDSFGNDFSFVVQGDKAALRFVSNPWLPPGSSIDSTLEIKTYGGGAETVTVSPDPQLDAFGFQVKTVEDCVAAGLKEAPRPSPQLDDSLEIMELLTEWEAAIWTSVKGQ